VTVPQSSHTLRFSFFSLVITRPGTKLNDAAGREEGLYNELG